ncbi:hypothetical protein NQ318_019839 [Aromia moschata]|uniref:Uncharacterized protein n=1 Tax=Aromia moschata TaxID=1265417 RepID=A0AAV8YMA0_9CUCU|nr:hypothetical protein NQ318_019839 [Aromia moschata]
MEGQKYLKKSTLPKKKTMKVLVFALIAFAVVGNSLAATKIEGDLADHVRNLLAYIKDVLPGDLKVTDVEVTIPDNDIETGSIKVNEASLTGLGDLAYTVGRSADDDTEVDFVASFDELLAVVDLELDLSGLLTFQTNLVISVDLLKIDFTGDVAINDDYTEATDFHILLSLEDDAISVKGLLSDEFSEELSTELTTQVPLIVNEMMTAVTDQVSDIIKYALNIALTIIDNYS